MESRRVRYRRIGGKAVDESLFGEPEYKTKRGSKGSSVSDPSAASLVISPSELQAIKSASIIKSEKDIIREREELERIKADKERKARARKERMLALAEHSAKTAKKSDMEIADEERKKQLKKLGEDKRDRDHDVVKKLISCAALASTFSLRDQQLLDKKQREQQETEYNRRMDTMMEIDRLADLKRRETEEAGKARKRKEDRKVITEQIQIRERQRMLEAEAKEQEGIQLKRQAQKYVEDGERLAAARQVELEKAREEVVRANEAAIAKKLADREAEKQEIRDILLYQAQQDAILAKREAEEAEIAAIKKERQKQLLAQQEKAQANAGARDELLARRAMEEKERITRRKEKEEALKRRNDTRHLLAERKKQEEDKKRMNAMELERDKYEHLKQLEHTMKTAGREDDERRSKHEAAIRHRELLVHQIRSDEDRKERMRGDDLLEGQRFRQGLVADEARFGTIRDQMIKNLEDKGANPAYLTAMKNLDIGKILRR